MSKDNVFHGPMDDYTAEQLAEMQRKSPSDYKLLHARHLDAAERWRETHPAPVPNAVAPYENGFAYHTDLQLAVALDLRLHTVNAPDLYEGMSRYRDAAIRASRMEFIEPESVAPQELRAIAPYTSVEALRLDIAIMLSVGLKPSATDSLTFPKLHRICAPFRSAWHAATLEAFQ